MGTKGSGHKSDAVFARMKALREQGKTYDEIAKAMPNEGCAETIRKEFKRRNALKGRTGPKANPVDEPTLRKLACLGKSLSQMGKHFGVSLGTARNYCLKWGIPIATRGSSRGSKHGRWKGGRHIKKGGHILIKTPHHPHCNRLGYVPEHRLVIENALGGYLLPSDVEVVHHDDHNPANNELSNLRLFCGRDEHDLYGHPERLWGISRPRLLAMLRRIRALRAKRRSLLDPVARSRRRLLRQQHGLPRVRARMVVGEDTRYVNVPTEDNERRQVHGHRKAMAVLLGRRLRSEERVHHEDGDKANNSVGNLFLFRCNGDHIKYHVWKGLKHFRTDRLELADRYLAENCTGMHNDVKRSPRIGNRGSVR
jgi:hypothetical protein